MKCVQVELCRLWLCHWTNTGITQGELGLKMKVHMNVRFRMWLMQLIVLVITACLEPCTPTSDRQTERWGVFRPSGRSRCLLWSHWSLWSSAFTSETQILLSSHTLHKRENKHLFALYGNMIKRRRRTTTRVSLDSTVSHVINDHIWLSHHIYVTQQRLHHFKKESWNTSSYTGSVNEPRGFQISCMNSGPLSQSWPVWCVHRCVWFSSLS